jgi:hypothetical protein
MIAPYFSVFFGILAVGFYGYNVFSAPIELLLIINDAYQNR